MPCPKTVLKKTESLKSETKQNDRKIKEEVTEKAPPKETPKEKKKFEEVNISTFPFMVVFEDNKITVDDREILLSDGVEGLIIRKIPQNTIISEERQYIFQSGKIVVKEGNQSVKEISAITLPKEGIFWVTENGIIFQYGKSRICRYDFEQERVQCIAKYITAFCIVGEKLYYAFRINQQCGRIVCCDLNGNRHQEIFNVCHAQITDLQWQNQQLVFQLTENGIPLSTETQFWIISMKNGNHFVQTFRSTDETKLFILENDILFCVDVTSWKVKTVLYEKNFEYQSVKESKGNLVFIANGENELYCYRYADDGEEVLKLVSKNVADFIFIGDKLCYQMCDEEGKQKIYVIDGTESKCLASYDKDTVISALTESEGGLQYKLKNNSYELVLETNI